MSSRFPLPQVLNYATRGIIVVIGVLLLFGLIVPPRTDSSLTRMFGVVFILFGLYRIATYYTAQKRFQREQGKE